MNDPQSVLRTVARVIEAELKPESVVILLRLNGENYMQPAGDAMQWPALVLSAASGVAETIAKELGRKISENCGQSADKPEPPQEGEAS